MPTAGIIPIATGGTERVQKLLASGPLLMILASGAFTTMTACTAIARGQMGGVDLVFWRALGLHT